MSGIRSRIIVCMGLALLLVAGRARSDDPWQAIPRALPPAGIEIDPAEPVLKSVKVSRTSDHTFAEYNICYYVGSRYRYFVTY